MLEENIADLRFVQINSINLQQIEHVVGVLHDTPRMPVLDCVAFQRQQIPQRDHSRSRHASRGGYRVCNQLFECFRIHEHEIQRHSVAGVRVQLNKSAALVVQRIAQTVRQTQPWIPIPSGNDQVNVKRRACVPVCNDGVASRYQKTQMRVIRCLRDRGEQTHNGRL